MFFNSFKLNFNLNRKFKFFLEFSRPSVYYNFLLNRTTHIFSNDKIVGRLNTTSPGFNLMCTDFVVPRHSNSCLIFKRFHSPRRDIDWVGIKTRWRAKQVLMRKRKHKNHPRVALRFRLTRFGWERLQGRRNAKKINMTRLQYKNKMRVKYVSRSDLKKLDRQMPGYRLRIRDPPINNNPNIRNARRVINNYFG